MTEDLDHIAGMTEFNVASAVGEMFDRSTEQWFMRRLSEDTVLSAIEQLNVVLVRKRAQRMERAA